MKPIATVTFILLVLALVCRNGYAQFPQSILERLDSGEIEFTDSGIFPIGGSAHWYKYQATDTAFERILVRHYIGGNSLHSETSNDGVPDIDAPLCGSAWMDLSTAYFPGGLNNRITVSMEHVTPSFFDDANFLGPEFELVVSDDVLMGATGDYFASIKKQNGNLISSSPIQCLAEGCTIGATFNLLGLRYVPRGELLVYEFESSDQSLLYEHFSSFVKFKGEFDFDHRQTYELDFGFIPGDANLDKEVNLLDVEAFVRILSLGVYQGESDANFDGQVNLLDVAAFVDLL